MLMRIQHFGLYIKYLKFKLRWMMLSIDDQDTVWCQVHLDTNAYHYDNYEQLYAAMNRGDDYQPDWQDLAAYLRGEDPGLRGEV